MSQLPSRKNSPTIPSRNTDPQVIRAVEELMNRPTRMPVDRRMRSETKDTFAQEAIEVFKKSMESA